MIAACAGQVGGAGGRAPAGSRDAVGPSIVQSNVLREDYAGSSACVPCHADVVARFARTPMHRMTRDARTAEIAAPFDGRELRLKDDVARLTTRGGERFVAITSAMFGDRTYRVTKVIGGHHREDFAGVDVAARGAEEEILPVSFLRATQALRYKGYSVMVKDRPALKAGPAWRRTCILCHNTGPLLASLYGALAPSAPYQGETVDPLLPAARRWSLEVTDERELARALGEEARRLGEDAAPPAATRARAVATTVNATRARFGEAHLVELGIGCESCHGGARAHVADPRVAPSFLPRASFFRVKDARGEEPRGEAEHVTRACARCHQVLFSGYPHTWEGGDRRGRAGGSHINSGEARDFLLGACTSQLTCTQCHDPHGGGTRAPEGVAGNAACTAGCHAHARYVAPEALAKHTHHAPDGVGSACLACHMPRKNMTLDGRLGRYHRIASPTEPQKVLLDRPLECALCHGDKSVASLVESMERMFGQRYDREALRRLYGDLGENVMLATLRTGKPHEKAVALRAVGDAKDRRALELAAAELAGAYPLVRGYAFEAVTAIAGERPPVDVHDGAAAIEAATRRWLAAQPTPR